MNEKEDMKQSSTLEDLLPEDLSLPRRTSLGEQAAETLRELILLEKLAPGMILSESQLTKLLGISRTPLREAIRILEMDGLIEYTTTRRPRVADPTLEELEEYLTVLGTLEALAGELACSHASDVELQRIVNLNHQLDREAGVEDALTYFQTDMNFHQAIVCAAHNKALLEIHKQCNARLWRARFIASRQPISLKIQAQNHKAIADALFARNSQFASGSKRTHEVVFGKFSAGVKNAHF